MQRLFESESASVSKGDVVARVLAALLGIVVLTVTTVFTAGGAAAAFVGFVCAGMIARSNGRGFSRGASWIGAVAGVAIVLVGVGVFVSAKAPPGTLAQIQKATDSVQAHPAPPPPWLDKIAPGASARAARTPRRSSGFAHAFGIWAGITGAMISIVLLSVIVGTIGWLATLPLAYAWRGRALPWPSAVGA